MLQVLVSRTGTGSLKRLWTVLPPERSVAAIPVHADDATWMDLLRQQVMSVLYTVVLPLPPVPSKK